METILPDYTIESFAELLDIVQADVNDEHVVERSHQ
jgi:hypothetical protein